MLWNDENCYFTEKDQKIWLDGVYVRFRPIFTMTKLTSNMVEIELEMNEIEQLNWKILSVECQLIESKFLLRYCF